VIGEEIHRLAQVLWPLNRSITGDGVRETLRIIQQHLPELTIHEVPSGTSAFDWVVPREWRIRSAYIATPDGRRICDLAENNLHVVGYSVPIDQAMPLGELNEHLHSLPDRPDAIPFVTSYYQERWGFCLTHRQRTELREGTYRVVIDSELFDGSLTYAEAIIPGSTTDEVFLSSYVCHPSMANNELSGPTVMAFLGKWLRELPARKYTYRLVFVPETIGSIAYLSRNLDWLKSHVVAGFNLSCVGDDRGYSYLPSRKGGTLSDHVAPHVLKWIDPRFVTYRWADRGSDERQYCAPGIDLPIASLLRSKFERYPEYHTSLDDLVNVVTPSGLEGGYNAVRLSLETIERHCFPRATVLGEPQLGRRGLYRQLSTPTTQDVPLILNVLTWADGTKSLVDIAEECGVPVWDLYPLVDQLVAHNLLTVA
jgi:aminopeptidase-like protein